VSDGSTALPDRISRAASHQNLIVLVALALATALGLWITLRTGERLMLPLQAGHAAYAVLLFIMWWSMMLAMMLPSAAPAILTYGAMTRKFAAKGASSAPAGIFSAGYAAIWTGFSLAATALHLALEHFLPLTGMMAVTSAAIGGSLLLAAGLYQMTPLKYACLHKCQAPLMFFARGWRKGRLGAFRMGVSHGIYCLGCCWVLMGLLFYGGVMELRWIIGIALYVALEKLIPVRSRVSQFTGLLLVVWGAWELGSAFK